MFCIGHLAEINQEGRTVVTRRGGLCKAGVTAQGLHPHVKSNRI